MSAEEKSEFENLLNSDPILQEKLNSFQNVKNTFSFYKETEQENSYSAPVLINKISGRKGSLLLKLFPTPAYIYSTAATLAVLVVMIFALSYFKSIRTLDISKVTSELKDSELSEALKTYSEDYYRSENTTEAITDSAVNNYYNDVLKNSSEEISTFISSNSGSTNYSSSILKNISDEEADKIYNELINKKIL